MSPIVKKKKYEVQKKKSDSNNNKFNHQITMLDVNKLKYDKKNPNVLSESELNGLRESMKRFGYLTPIIVDKNYLIADGEHRAHIYKEFEVNKIPAYVLDISNQDRVLLRQTMNKLRGTHDLTKDAQELSYLQNNELLFDLSVLIAQNEHSLNTLIQEYNVSIEQNKDKGDGDGDDDELIGSSDISGSKGYKEIDSELPTSNTCPKCGYSW